MNKANSRKTSKGSSQLNRASLKASLYAVPYVDFISSGSVLKMRLK